MTTPSTQRGIAVVAAMFLIVVLAAMAAFMVSVTTAQQATAAQDHLGTKAYWAARGGLEWGVASANASSACPAASSTLTVDGFSVSLDCSVLTFTEAGATVRLIQLRSVAISGTLGTTGYVERSVSASLEK